MGIYVFSASRLGPTHSALGLSVHIERFVCLIAAEVARDSELP